MSKVEEPILKSNGEVDLSLKNNLRLDYGLFLGVGYLLDKDELDRKRVYLSWKDLNSHLLVLGTTRMGKSRTMASIIDQQIAKDENVIVWEPKGSEGQEVIAWTMESAIRHGKSQSIRYISPAFPNITERFNIFYKKKNEEISATIESIIDSEDFYKKIGKLIVMSTCLGLEFAEEYTKLSNPYVVQIMEMLEYLAVKRDKARHRNKFIHGEYFEDGEFNEENDILNSLRKEIPIEKYELFDEAVIIVQKLRKGDNQNNDILPLRSFMTLKDLSIYDNLENCKALKDKVEKMYEAFKSSEHRNNEELDRLGQEAVTELRRVCAKDAGFFSKVSTTYSVVMSELVTGDIGYLLCSSRINKVLDDLTSPNRSAIYIVQPFPMTYKGGATAIGKIMFTMISDAAGRVGMSGEMLKRRIYLNIDEAGSILIPIIKEISNKGGGLGFSLCLYTQSKADIIETLTDVGARILFDNLNNKIAFRGNDNESTADMAEILGQQKNVKSQSVASDKRDIKQMNSVQTEAIADGSELQILGAQVYVAKLADKKYIAKSTDQPDPLLKVVTPIKSLSSMSLESDAIFKKVEKAIL